MKLFNNLEQQAFALDPALVREALLRAVKHALATKHRDKSFQKILFADVLETWADLVAFPSEEKRQDELTTIKLTVGKLLREREAPRLTHQPMPMIEPVAPDDSDAPTP